MAEFEFRGLLEIDQKGFGFTRQMSREYAQSDSDVYVPRNILQQYELREGCILHGMAKEGKKSREAVELIDVNGIKADEYCDVPHFKDGIVIAPHERLVLETRDMTSRIIDLIVPVGRGQRALIVAPPKSGKTIMMQNIAKSLIENYPDLELLLLLIDERPEEVTDMERMLKAKVFASSNDKDFESHSRIARFTLEYAKRQVEVGKDIVILLDSLTRLGRVFNAGQKGSGRIMSGGIDARALETPKKIFGASRKIENGGSLTIIATILVDTGSRMDELIFQEFKGTGNSEIVLDRELSDLRIYPALNIQLSGTRREELLLGEDLEKHTVLRRALLNGTNKDAMIGLIDLLRKHRTNKEVLDSIHELAVAERPQKSFTKGGPFRRSGGDKPSAGGDQRQQRGHDRSQYKKNHHNNNNNNFRQRKGKGNGNRRGR